MDDGEGGLSFDFEGGLETGPTQPTASVPVIPPENTQPHNNANNNYSSPASAAADPVPANFQGRKSYRQTVCRHWLRSLCMKGDACGFLHQYDKARMPICRFFRLFGECREQDCVYKHTNEDIKECNMYKLGFCPNGTDCRYRHAKIAGPPPPVEEVLQKVQHTNSYNFGNSNRFYQNRNPNYGQQSERSAFPQASNGVNQTINPATTDQTNVQQQQQQVQPTPEQVSQAQPQNLQSGEQIQSQPSKNAIPLPQGITRYFIVKSCNRENLELSTQNGVWATQRSNEAKLNEAFDTVENVILIFSVNRTQHFQGCAKMTSKIGGSVGGGNWKYGHGTAHYGRNFSVKWLKLCELSFHKSRHLRNPYNENLPVKISRDCQELEPSIGEQLASLLYTEPDSDLMATSVAAEAKREEEKAKGLAPENGSQNPNIVPFEDNEEEEEEEEEESEEEDESYGPLAFQGRGRGRGGGMMWQPHLPFPRGPRPIMGMRGPMMGEGFNYGPHMPDLFTMGAGPRGFPPYGPRFPGDFPGPAPGMMFPGRPGNFPGGGFGMMIGPGPGPGGRVPFMGGRPPFFLPQPPVNRPKRPASEMSSLGSGQQHDDGQFHQQKLKSQQGQQDERFSSRASGRNDGSESEDEAPRRSRHGEGKKQRREESDNMIDNDNDNDGDDDRRL